MSLAACPQPDSPGRVWDLDQQARPSPFAPGHSPEDYQALGRLFENRQDAIDRRVIPRRILAARIVKADRLYRDGYIGKRDRMQMRRAALTAAGPKHARAHVWACVRELRWLEAQGAPAHAPLFREAARLFGT